MKLSDREAFDSCHRRKTLGTVSFATREQNFCCWFSLKHAVEIYRGNRTVIC